MMRIRLREAHQDVAAFYSGRYPNGYQHHVWPDHVERIRASVEFLNGFLQGFPASSLADLSCGDGSLAFGLAHHVNSVTLGDLNGVLPDTAWDALARQKPPGFRLAVLPAGPLPDTLDMLTEPVDLYLCSETLEHLDDPDGFLLKARQISRTLFISTPEGEEGDGNHEHYWGWDSEAVEVMLREAGWNPVDHAVFTPVSAEVYRFQFWACI